jgi:hypothetical protein
MIRSPVLRGAAVVVAVATSAWGAAHAASSSAEEGLLAISEFGSELARAGGARVEGVVVNGLSLRLASGTLPDDPSSAVARFAAICRLENARFAREVEGIWGRSSARVQSAAQLFDGTLRADRDGRGAVACLSGVTLGTITRRIERFLSTGDVAEVGALRLVSLERTGAGTHCVALWSDGSLPVLGSFPAHGDAPGSDLDGVPRPSHGERRLSAHAIGAPVQMAVYAAPEPDARRYQDVLRAAGFRVEEVAGRPGTILARRGGRSVVVALEAGDPAVLVTVVSL